MLGRRGRPPYPGPLTPAEQRVLEHLRQGLTNPEIAVRLGISVNTVRFHVSNLLTKANLSSREQLANWDPPADAPPRRWLALPFGKLALGGATAVAAATVGGMLLAATVNDSAPTLPAEQLEDPTTPSVQQPLPAVVLPIYSPEAGGDSLGVGGELVRDGACLYLESANRRVLLAFSEGTAAWDEARATLTVHGVTYPLGYGQTDGGLPAAFMVYFPRPEFWLTPPDPTCDTAFVAGIGSVPRPPPPPPPPPMPRSSQ